MDTAYREHYRELFERHWWWRARTEFIVAALERLTRDRNAAVILDIGCGDGLFFERLSKFGDVEGFDLEVALNPESKWRNQIHAGSFDGTFDPATRYSLILMLDVLEHLSDPIAALKNARRLLTPDGFVLATVPAFKAAWTGHDVLNQHVTRFTKRTFRALFQSSGLDVLEQQYFFHWPFFAKLFLHGYETLVSQTPKVPQVPPKWLNRSLYSLCHAEQSAFRRVSLPFGSSLMAVATSSKRI